MATSPLRPPAAPSAPAAIGLERTIAGQVFVTTRGAGSYKFAGAHIAAYDDQEFEKLARWQHSFLAERHNEYVRGRPVSRSKIIFETWLKALVRTRPVAAAQTDADGNFTLRIPEGVPVFLVCHTTRLVGKDEEANLWILRRPGAHVNLNNDNLWEQPPL